MPEIISMNDNEEFTERWVEMVARAICEAEGYDPNADTFEAVAGFVSPSNWQNWMAYKKAANAAIVACIRFNNPELPGAPWA